MNLFYLSPSLRREFLDNILSNSFDEYSELLKNYKKIVISRNKLLKSIQE
jgi:recombinational DNA repair ATPase RecF